MPSPIAGRAMASADMLALPLSLRDAARNSAALALPFARLHGQTPGGDGPILPPKRYHAVAAEWAQRYLSSAILAVQSSGGSAVGAVAVAQAAVSSQALPVAACMLAATQGLASLGGKMAAQSSPAALLVSDKSAMASAIAAVYGCHGAAISADWALSSATGFYLLPAAALRWCGRLAYDGRALAVRELALDYHGMPAAGCRSLHSGAALAVPCDYYDIPVPEPEPPEPDYACGLRPSAANLPLALMRRRWPSDPATLPLPFACRVQTATPVLRAYMIVNHVSAADGSGRPLTLLSASITSDMGGYCWQGNITLPPEDFARLNMEARQKGAEAEIIININDMQFKILAEESGDERKFGQKSYTIKGRSLTARLGEDYATRAGQLYSAPIYAQQIVREQLKATPYTLAAYAAADWLVPADVYGAGDKTPMAVISDIAQAAGAFVESHPSEPTLSIKPRWKAAAWQVAAAEPDVVVPASVITQISGSRRVAQRANGVFVSANHLSGRAADVYRTGTAREPRASALSHALYTDHDVLQAAGLAALSESGTHKIEVVTLPVADKYALPLAQKGQIWQIAEPTGSWQGVVTGITLDVKISGDAPEVWQTVTIDRYLDD